MVNYTIHFTDTSEFDLETIAVFIAQDNPVRASTFIDDIIIHINTHLSSFPYTGTQHREGIYKGAFPLQTTPLRFREHPSFPEEQETTGACIGRTERAGYPRQSAGVVSRGACPFFRNYRLVR